MANIPLPFPLLEFQKGLLYQVLCSTLLPAVGGQSIAVSGQLAHNLLLCDPVDRRQEGCTREDDCPIR